MIGVLIILALIVLNGLFVAMEFVIVGARLSRLETLSNRGQSIAQALDSVYKQDRYVAVAQLGITLASIGLGMYGEHKIAGWLEAPLHSVGIEGASVHLIALVIAVIILTYLHVVFGEMIPKAMALQSAETLLIALWPLIRLFEGLFRPFVRLLNAISQFLLARFGLNRAEARFFTPRELVDIAEDSSKGGTISTEQSNFIGNIIRLQGRRIDELMTPRKQVISIDLEKIDDADLTDTLLKAGPSRLPVVRGGLDRVLGVVHVKDVIRYQARTDVALTRENIEEILHPLPKVIASLDTGALLDSMRQHATHMALVSDENGSVLGVITLEDAIEEVVGDVHSEFELDEPKTSTRYDQHWKIVGTMPLARLREGCDVALESESARTIGGLLLEQIRRVPKVGDSCTIDGLRFEIETVDGLSIESIRVTQVQDPPSDNPTA